MAVLLSHFPPSFLAKHNKSSPASFRVPPRYDCVDAQHRYCFCRVRIPRLQLTGLLPLVGTYGLDSHRVLVMSSPPLIIQKQRRKRETFTSPDSLFLVVFYHIGQGNFPCPHGNFIPYHRCLSVGQELHHTVKCPTGVDGKDDDFIPSSDFFFP